MENLKTKKDVKTENIETLKPFNTFKTLVPLCNSIDPVAVVAAAALYAAVKHYLEVAAAACCGARLSLGWVQRS